MTREIPRKQDIIMSSQEIFQDAPGYDPLDLRGDAPKLTTPPLQLLLSVRQEGWRGGCMDIVEFVSPAPDIAMHFRQPVQTNDAGVHYCIADLLVTTSFRATFAYSGAPDEYPRSGIYYRVPSEEGRSSYELGSGELLVGQPEIYPMAEPILREISDGSDEYSTDAHRVLADTSQLAATLDRFGSVLNLSQPDRQAFAQHLIPHLEAARSLRRIRNMGHTPLHDLEA